MFSKQLLNKIFIQDKSADEYLVFNHSDKTWIMPVENILPALDMYQPSSIKGKILKSLIKSFYKNKMIEKFGCKIEKLRLDKKVLEGLNISDNHGKIYVAAYMGDTSSI